MRLKGLVRRCLPKRLQAVVVVSQKTDEDIVDGEATMEMTTWMARQEERLKAGLPIETLPESD